MEDTQPTMKEPHLEEPSLEPRKRKTTMANEKEESKSNKDQSFFVYLLQSSRQGVTYVGATIDVHKRLRQHNQEIKGGAIATGVRVALGETWRRVCYVSNFPTWQAALQFEWKWKDLTRKITKTKTNTNTNTNTKQSPVHRRMMALYQLLHSTQSTSKAVPFAEWSTPPMIHFEADSHEQEAFYASLSIASR